MRPIVASPTSRLCAALFIATALSAHAAPGLYWSMGGFSSALQQVDGSRGPVVFGQYLQINGYENAPLTPDFIPTSISFDSILGNPLSLVLADFPSYGTYPANPSYYANAGFDSQPWGQSLWAIISMESTDPADITPFTATVHGGIHDGVQIAVSIDPFLAPEPSKFTNASLAALNAAIYGPTINLEFSSFVVPANATNAQRVLVGGDLFTNGIAYLDPAATSYLFSTAAIIAGNSYFIGVTDSFTIGDTQYSSSVIHYFVGNGGNGPQPVPDSSRTAVLLICGLLAVSAVKRRLHA